ncbi:TetR/AcrR family transcriptional regulator [Anaerocolumna sp. AGMB13020]|uniref:TetR/AcrR family transcriptional regulator n=1 Tax=Anaerocolumna sp. AGMB13020 TaxID=3081750 RepID=UPI0029558D0B|nr:TetR/AcrR family transcriptional regulator [Anaerocolumna sp. AGMB13020]WOO38732.1 TetR/AcrR family transcriptional regulator [Anaerocolumna sp. AGMB13020]
MQNNEKIREPKQKRAIEKKQKIIRASYKLFSEKGYYKTNTAEIAQAAGVSTGIVYSYFEDKKHILVEVIKHYLSLLSEKLNPLLTEPVSKKKLTPLIEEFINISIKSHIMNKEAHNEFLALSLLESEIQTLFDEFENAVLQKFCELLETAGFSKDNMLEKVRIGYSIIEQVSHYYIQEKLPAEELNRIKLLAVNIIVTTLTENNRK